MTFVSNKVYNVNILTIGVYMLTLAEDLGMEVMKSGRKFRHGMFECSACKNIVKMLTQNAKRNTYCFSCSHKTHSLSDSRQYKIWNGIISRTTRKSQTGYSKYKDRKPSEKWMTFEGFWDDMEEGYEEGLTIDRKDNSKPYSKENCRWVTRTIQAQNRSKKINNSSGYIGVQKNWNQYEANIQHNKKKHYLGLFKTAKEAAMAREKFIIDNGTAHPLNFIGNEG